MCDVSIDKLDTCDVSIGVPSACGVSVDPGWGEQAHPAGLIKDRTELREPDAEPVSNPARWRYKEEISEVLEEQKERAEGDADRPADEAAQPCQ